MFYLKLPENCVEFNYSSRAQVANYSIAPIKTTHDANYSTGALIQTTKDANYSTGALKITHNANYSIGPK